MPVVSPATKIATAAIIRPIRLFLGWVTRDAIGLIGAPIGAPPDQLIKHIVDTLRVSSQHRQSISPDASVLPVALGVIMPVAG